MSGIAVVYYDGRTATPQAATLKLGGDGLVRLERNGRERIYAAADVRIGDRIGAQAPRVIEFPDGDAVHVPPDEDVDRLLDAIGGRRQGWLRRLESRWHHALGALAIAVILIAVLFRYGLPALAGAVVEQVPLAFERRIGQKALEEFDDEWLGPSGLAQSRQDELREKFLGRIAKPSGFELPMRLEFREGREIGPNALALPGGIVVVTDELIAFAEHDDEILVVLAHEAGHVVGRHSLRQGVEGLGITLVMSAVTGDLSGLASIAAALPVLLMQSGYSRRDERAADAHAFAWADAHGVARTRMTDLMQRIEAKLGDGGIPGLFSTHPSSAERAREAAGPR